MSIGTLIKTIQDIMRKDVGVDGDAQRISQIVWLLFLKIFDDKEQEWQLTVPGYKSPLQTRFRWSNWAKNAEGITGEELIDCIRAINHRLAGVWRMHHRSVFCESWRTAHANHERAGPGVLGSPSECH